jgi:transposase-like protein
MKYSKEYKLECVRKYKEGIPIEDPPNTNHKQFRSQIRKWNRIFDSLGEAGLEYGRPTLNVSQRLELIQRVENGESYRSAAFSAGIQHDLLIKWHKIYKEFGIDGLQSLKRGRPCMNDKKHESVKKQDSDKTKEELLEELEYVRAENEYLKKLSALVQERKAREQKKK